jgi:glucose/arabinose dehydrogenase
MPKSTSPPRTNRRRRSLTARWAGLALAGTLFAFNAPSPQAQSGDVTPPTLTARSPAPGATGVSPVVNARAVFSEPIQAAALSMVLRDPANQIVAAHVAYDAATRTATLDPDADLTAATQFTVTVSDARDVAGNVMAATSWAFTTATSQFTAELLPQTGLTQPTVVRFASDGRLYVAQKDGRIWFYDDLADTTPTLVADLRVSVYNFWDRGLLGMALHPNFPASPYIYTLYSYDALPGGTAPFHGAPPYTHESCSSATGTGCVISGRLTRLDIGDQLQWPLDHTDEQVLVTDWPQQFPSHSTGSLAFGPDGALYASGGDGASFNYVDSGQTATNPPGLIVDPPHQGGALRSQDIRTSGDPVTLDGSIIRIDPNNGAALSGNPRFLSDPDPNGQRIVAYGLRNPFRIANRPGTNEIWIGDVGWSTYEEINRLVNPTDTVIDNFGWPCYEGNARQGGYDTQNLSICEDLYAAGAGAIDPPLLAYQHAAALQGCGSGSSSIAGLAFHPVSGGSYPAPYAGALFFADYSRSCIWAMRAGGDGVPDPADVVLVLDDTSGPVDLVTSPGGDIVFPGFNDHRLHRLRYSANLPPTAVVAASSNSGPSPLAVDFSAAGSSDPEDQPLTYAWDLDGDGAFDDATGASAQWTYTTPAIVTVRLLVTDAASLSDVQQTTIVIDNSAPTAIIDSPTGLGMWRVGGPISFWGHATDPDQPSGVPASGLSWEVIIHHCPSDCHTHSVQTFAGVAEGNTVGPDHEYPAHLELRLTATDANGLQDTASVLLHPQTVDLTFQTIPTGLQLGVNAASQAAPFTRRVIMGSNNSVSAPGPQTVGAQSYAFGSWSDRGAANHNLVAETPTTYTAAYAPVGIPAGLVAAYGMNEGSGATIADVTDQGHTGAIVGADWNAQGRFGAALQFDGIDDLVTVADAPDLNPGAAMTLEAWVRPAVVADWRTVALKEAPAGLAYALYANDDGARWAAYVNTGAADVAAESTAALPLNTWSHIAMTYDGSMVRAYLNGAQVGSRAATGAIRATAGALQLGGNSVWSEWFSGLIDEVRFYNRALSASEIAQDMHTPVGGGTPSDTTAPAVALTAPADKSVLGEIVDVTATATDNVSVASVQFLLDGNPLGSADTTAPYHVSWNTATAAAGPHVLSAIAVDDAGNGAAATMANVTVDNVPPTVAITAPSPGATVRGFVTITAEASDANGIEGVQFVLNGSHIGPFDRAAPYTFDWTTSNQGDGKWNITAVARDAARNQGLSAVVSVIVDNKPNGAPPPTVTITDPPSGTSVFGPWTVNANAFDADGIASVQFKLDGADLGSPDITPPYSTVWTTTASADGPHSLTAVATDAGGLQTTSAVVNVTVANGWVVPSGLVAAYTFGEGAGATAGDASGSGRVGIIGGATWTPNGRFGQGLSFDGIDDWVTVADAAALDLTTGMTIEAWVRPTALGGWRTVVMKEAAGGLAYSLYADDDTPSRPAGYVNRNNRDVSAPGAGPLPLDTWTHLAVTYGGGFLRLYVNGVQAGSTAVNGNIRTTTDALRIGGNSVWGEYFAGSLDEVRIYNRALTAMEIQAGMDQTLGGQ